MEHSEAIRRAVGRIPTPEPPSDLSARVMERLRRAERQRRRIEAALTGICVAGCLAGMAAVGYWALARESGEPGIPHLQPLPGERMLTQPDGQLHHFGLPQLDLTVPGDAGLWRMAGMLAAAVLILLVADLLIRRRLAAQRK